MFMIGSRLKQLRQQRGYTLQQVADKMNVTPTAIVNYEKGKRKPPMEKIKKFADLFDVTTDYLTGHQTDLDNLANVLRNNKLHWDGVPIQEKELELIRDFLLMMVENRSDDAKKNGSSED